MNAAREDKVLGLWPLLLLVAGLYFLLHPYEGLIHDARLYTLQALNHLHPELYGNDIFLKYGSQDSYTLFTPLYARLMSLLGAERAASLITFISVITLLSAAWQLARTLMPTQLAWVALGVLVLIPGFYGEGIVFSVFEGFITPRMLAEALVLFSIAAWLKQRRAQAILLGIGALLIHPIMAFPGVVLLLVLAVLGSGSLWRRLWPLPLVGVLGAVLALLGWIPLTRWQFDAAWRPVAEWAPHLSLAEWTLNDWARVVTVLATLAFAARWLPDLRRRLALGMMIATGLLLLLSWVGGDLLGIVLVVQGQAWRCLWLATTLAVLLLPLIAAHCWPGSPLQRCGLLLLVTSWLVGHQSLALFFSIPALIALAPTERLVPVWAARLAERAAWILLAVVIICMLALTWSELGRKPDPDFTAHPWFEFLRTVCDDRVLPSAALLGIWYASTRSRSRAQIAVLALSVALPAGFIVTQTTREWLQQYYTEDTRHAFAPWRDIIPPGNDVLWSVRLMPASDPTTVWLLLERPSYFSAVQFNSGLFSRAAAMELIRRNKTIPRSLPTEQPIPVVFGGKAAPVCAEVPARYIVSDVKIADAEIIPAPDTVEPPFDRLLLQICAENGTGDKPDRPDSNEPLSARN